MKVHFLGNTITLTGQTLKVGDTFPDFRVADINFNKITLKNTQGRRLFLTIPSLLTDVCSTEISKINELLQDKDVSCYVFSLDLPFTFTKYSKNFKNITLLSDVKYANFGKTTGTRIKELGILTRAAFIINKDNIIEYVDYIKEITDEPNYEEIFNVL